nr:hypothetical protein [Tanacetum cinerariifolium]
MTEMFSLLKEYSKGKSPEKGLVGEEVSKPVTKYVNAISFVRIENDEDKECDKVIDKKVTKQTKVAEKEKVVYDVKDSELDRSINEGSTRWGKYVDRLTQMPRSRPIGYYLKYEINKKTIEDLVDNHKYNDSLLTTHLGKMDNETYKSLPVGPMYDAILKKKLARKNGRACNFVIAYIKEDDYMHLILGTSFLTIARAKIKCDKGSMTLRAGKFKSSTKASPGRSPNEAAMSSTKASPGRSPNEAAMVCRGLED